MVVDGGGVVEVLTRNVVASLFQWYSVPHPGLNTPTFTVCTPRGSPLGTVHVADSVRACPAANDWPSHQCWKTLAPDGP